ncbi:MAG: SOS response-associated peptidase family protein [Reichenbachiella sp.]|uniref:SOS response-associated peptidase family protein n=1 Tax=Reichenbachiella sp. TaxID=2184521 RepID=UPI0032644DAA
MCGTAGQMELDFGKDVEKEGLDKFKRSLNQLKELSPMSYRVSMDSMGVIITQSGDEPKSVRSQFAWYTEKGKGGIRPVFNVRCEGGFMNREDDPGYKGPFKVFSNPYVKDIIRAQRCLIPVNFFIEQPKDRKIKKKFLVEYENKKPFFLGGIYKEFLDESTGELKSHFAVFTTAYTAITKKAMHHRSPLIVPLDLIGTFLDQNISEDTLTQFFYPGESSGMVCYEVDVSISKKKDHPYKADDKRYIEPKGDIMLPDSSY